MALRPENRENLLRDATAFPQRLLFRLLEPASQETSESSIQEVFVGIKQDQAYSVYLEQEIVLQFDSEGLLRRLFFEDRKFAALNGHLLELIRKSGERVRLEQQQLSETDEHALLAKCQSIVHGLLPALMTADCQTFPSENADILRKIALEKIQPIAAGIKIAASL